MEMPCGEMPSCSDQGECNNGPVGTYTKEGMQLFGKDAFVVINSLHIQKQQHQQMSQPPGVLTDADLDNIVGHFVPQHEAIDVVAVLNALRVFAPYNIWQHSARQCIQVRHGDTPFAAVVEMTVRRFQAARFEPNVMKFFSNLSPLQFDAAIFNHPLPGPATDFAALMTEVKGLFKVPLHAVMDAVCIWRDNERTRRTDDPYVHCTLQCPP